MGGGFQVSFILVILHKGKLRQGSDLACGSIHSRTAKERIVGVRASSSKIFPLLGSLSHLAVLFLGSPNNVAEGEPWRIHWFPDFAHEGLWDRTTRTRHAIICK